MKDYSASKTKYGIIEYQGMFAIVEVNIRRGEEIINHKPDTLSLSKYVSTLQSQIKDMLKREETRAEQLAQEEWRASLMRERLATKVGVK